MQLDANGLLNDSDTKTFFISDLAMAVIGKMFAHTGAVANTYGLDSEVYAAQADSLANCLTAVLTRTGFGRPMHITQDGEMSLYCNEDGRFVFGMIFFRDRRYDGAEVQPGTWSLHS
jgi:hypothetical protein